MDLERERIETGPALPAGVGVAGEGAIDGDPERAEFGAVVVDDGVVHPKPVGAALVGDCHVRECPGLRDGGGCGILRVSAVQYQAVRPPVPVISLAGW
ncbi:MAG: hypothetical protein WCL16_14015 [bacterium]